MNDDLEEIKKQILQQTLLEMPCTDVPKQIQPRVKELISQGVPLNVALSQAQSELESKSSQLSFSSKQDFNITWFIALSLGFGVCGLIKYSTIFTMLSFVFFYFARIENSKNSLLKLSASIILSTILLRVFDVLTVHGYLPEWLWFYNC